MKQVYDYSPELKLALTRDNDDEAGEWAYEPADKPPFEFARCTRFVYLRQAHFVAGTVAQGLVIVKNGTPNPEQWTMLSRGYYPD